MRVCREGSALKVSNEMQADRFFPLRRLSRVVADRRVSFETEALIYCALAGVPVLFLDQEGGIVVRVIGSGGRNDDLRRRLEAFTAIPDWRERFHNWLWSMQRRVSTTVVKRLGYPRHLAHRPKNLRDHIRRHAKSLAGTDAAAFSDQQLTQLCIGLVQKELQARGLDARDEAWQLDEVDLASVLGGLLAQRIQPIRLGWLQWRFGNDGRGVAPSRPLRRKEIIHMFEHNSSRIGRLSRDLINRLHRWLVVMD